jgi:hypothetical protein
LIAFEKLSRYILAPVTAQNNLQTCCFFERARGQYKTLRNREGFTKSRQSAFDRKYHKNQMFTKIGEQKNPPPFPTFKHLNVFFISKTT